MIDVASAERDRIYQEERIRLEAQEAAKAARRTKRLRGFGITVLCVFISIPAIIFGIVGVNRWVMENDVGAEGLLNGKYYKGVKMYDSPDSLYHHIASGGKEDVRMMEDGRILLVPDTLRVRIIGTDGASYKIEILPTEFAGKLAGKSGWIERHDVRILADNKK